MLKSLRNTFAAPAMAATTAFLPITGMQAHAEAPPYSTIKSTSVSSAEDIQSILNRNKVIKEAAAYPEKCPGEIGVSILMGNDTGNASADFFSQNLKSGFKTAFGLSVATFDGENAPGEPTEFTYSYAHKDARGQRSILTLGPYNADEVLEQAPEIARTVKAIRLFENVGQSHMCLG